MTKKPPILRPRARTTSASPRPSSAHAGSTPSSYTKTGRLKSVVYEAEMARLQEQLVMLQYWIQSQGLKVLVIFEGRGSAGKGGVIQRITERTSPRTVRVVALPTPTERQKTQWYFQRYVEHLPAAGRDGPVRPQLVQPLERRVGDGLLHRGRAPGVPALAARSSSGCWCAPGITVIKYWFSVSYEEQRTPLRGPQRRAAQALEALRHGPRRARVLREVLHGQGHHVPVHRHQAGALVRRPLRRQEGRPAQLHLPPAQPVRLPRRGTRRRGAAGDEGPCRTSGRRCTSRRSCPSSSDTGRDGSLTSGMGAAGRPVAAGTSPARRGWTCRPRSPAGRRRPPARRRAPACPLARRPRGESLRRR